MMQLKMSAKGELVIPKKIREQLGFSKERNVFLTVRDKEVIIRPLQPSGSIAKKWAERAKHLNLKSSDIIHGDALYEEGAYF